MSYQEDRFTEIADSIRSKIGGGAIQATQFASKIGLINSDDAYTVRFIDYDGTILSEQIVAPGGSVTPPTVTNKAATNLRPALTFQGWNHPQSEFDNVQCDIDAGAIYVPTDGKTHVYLRLNAATGLAIPLYLNKADTSLMTIDWGDGTTSTSSASGDVTFTSNYASIGLKHITITGSNYKIGQGAVSSVFVGGGTQIYKDSLISLYIGNGGLYLHHLALYLCQSLVYATLHNNIVITNGSGSHFSSCRSLKHLSIPQSFTVIPSSFIASGFALESVSLPHGLTAINSDAFSICRSMNSVSFPITLTSISTASFRYCGALKKIVITKNITYVASSAFRNCTALETVLSYANINSIYGVYAFSENSALKTIYFSNGVPLSVVKDGIFLGTYAQDNSIQPPQGVTSIGTYAYSSNSKRTYLIIPDSVTLIGATSMNACTALKYIIFNPTNPPTMENVSALSANPASCIYFVPDASLTAYQTATNWATYANQIRPYSEFNINDFQ